MVIWWQISLQNPNMFIWERNADEEQLEHSLPTTSHAAPEWEALIQDSKGYSMMAAAPENLRSDFKCADCTGWVGGEIAPNQPPSLHERKHLQSPILHPS